MLSWKHFCSLFDDKDMRLDKGVVEMVVLKGIFDNVKTTVLTGFPNEKDVFVFTQHQP